MSISPEEFKKISHLARLEFSGEEEKAMQKSLGEFVGYLEKLKALNTENIKPMMRVDDSLKELRRDEIVNGLKHEDAMKNAPQVGQGHFSIPKIVK